MPTTRLDLEARERTVLAAHAQCSGDSRGRVHPETPPALRTQFQRDRDRIIHSRAFRRLEYKTQVFLNGTGDHLRTRLTHTMEVAGISRNIARALGLNEDLTEAIALAHDLGHSPVGHKGEQALDRLMKDHGGFEHNRQSLRVVEWIEQKYPGFAGLNLSWEVREGLAKHQPDFTGGGGPYAFRPRHPSLEAQVANLADEIAYYSHDLDDGLDAGLLNEKKLMADVEIWAMAARQVKKEFGSLPNECRRYFTIRTIIDGQVMDVVKTTESRVFDSGVRSADDIRMLKQRLVAYSPDRRRLNLDLRKYLYRNLYYNPVVHEPNRRAVKLLQELFLHLEKHPEHWVDYSRKRQPKDGFHRSLCDYVSGMTDRFLMTEHRRLLGSTP